LKLKLQYQWIIESR